MAASRTQAQPTYEDIMRDISQKRFKPVYLLMGAENYYIDTIADAIVDGALAEDERAFNLTTYYGLDAELGSVINSARSYPMGAARSVVLLKEAQHMKSLDDLAFYLQNPQSTTVLVITYKNGTVDRRRKFVTAIQQQGVLFESKKPADGQLPAYVTSYVTRHGYDIDRKSASIIAESIGNDLSRLYGELDKLMTALPEGEKSITPQRVEENIGISKDFNYFELQNALVERDIFKANQIAVYFDRNSKANPIQMILPTMFRFFSNALMAYYSPDRSERGIAMFLGVPDWQVRRNILPVLHNYTARKVLQILDEIRATDEKSKGMNGSKVSSGDLLRSLVFFILH